MEPTRILSEEHRVIEVMLACLKRMTEQAVVEKKLDREAAEQAVDFIRTFADGCHHGKEEEHLFTLLTAKGMPKEGGPVGQMLFEHEQGRAFVRGMDENIAAAAEGNEAALQGFVSHANGYVELLRNHIHKEDNILFPMADRMLSADDQKNLLDNFHRVETEHMGAGTHEKYLGIALKLAERFGVSTEGIAKGSCACGHGH